MANEKIIEFGIRDIAYTDFFVDESKTPEPTFELQYRADLKIAIKDCTALFKITAIYSEKASGQVFMKGGVETLFEIKDMQNFALTKEGGKEAVDFPEHFWATLFSIAFTHARAGLAMLSGRSKFQKLILPVINPTLEFRKIFAEELRKSTTP